MEGWSRRLSSTGSTLTWVISIQNLLTHKRERIVVEGCYLGWMSIQSLCTSVDFSYQAVPLTMYVSLFMLQQSLMKLMMLQVLSERGWLSFQCSLFLMRNLKVSVWLVLVSSPPEMLRTSKDRDDHKSDLFAVSLTNVDEADSVAAHEWYD